MTHGKIVTGAGATTAVTKTQIGSDLTLPAGGPWTIFGIFGQVVKVTAVADEGTGGQLIIDAVSGDITPDPAPGKWPLLGSPACESANFNAAAMGLNIWDVNWEASGKAVLQLSYLNQLAITAGSYVQAGIIFGNEIPAPVRAPFCASVYAAFASATEQSVGSITLAEKATKIVGILAELNKGDSWTVAEQLIGYIRLASDSIKLQPAQYPCCFCFDSGDGTVAGECSMPRADFIPVDIPVEGGAIVDVYVKTPISVTGNAEVRVYLAYE